MIVYSVEYQEGRSTSSLRKWFGSEKLADDWMHARETMRKRRVVSGPDKHVIEGKAGLLSFLQTYKGRE